MELILCIETAERVCSIALFDGEELLQERKIEEQNAHSKHLLPLIDGMFAESELEIKDLSAVAISSGPGSYTGLRIGSSTGKGICYALDIPLIAIDSLEIQARGLLKENTLEGDVRVMMDARRMEVYDARFNKMGTRLTENKAVLLEEEVNQDQLVVIGSGAEKCLQLATFQSVKYIAGNFLMATNMGSLAYTKYLAEDFEDIAYFEPHYLKEFHFTTPKNKLKP